MQKAYIAVIGLGAIGTPLSHLLWRKYKDDFVLLASNEIAKDLKKEPIYINGELFSPKIISKKSELEKPIKQVYICVKNYHLESAYNSLKELIDSETILLPLQNGVYSYHYMSEMFPQNTVLEGFAQGPNTRRVENGFEYQKSGAYHFGTSKTDCVEKAHEIFETLSGVGIPCYWEKDIKHAIWKKLMLNVAGNAMTALTEIDYAMFKHSKEAQKICRIIMREFKFVAAIEDILITEADIEDVMNYFLSYDKSKRTSMLEDALNKRMTENEYIAGYIKRLAEKNAVSVPFTDMLYSLMKIKEEVYLGILKAEN